METTTSQDWVEIRAFKRHLLEENRSRHTLRAYMNHLITFYDWLESEGLAPSMSAIAEPVVKSYQTFLADLGHKDTTINLKLCAIKALTAWGVRSSRLTTDPMQHYPLLRINKSAPRSLNLGEQNRLLQTVDYYGSLRDRILIRVCLETGIKVGELSTVEWQDVNLTQGSLRLKGVKIRLSEALLTLMIKLQEEQGQRRFVFVSSHKKPLAARSVRDLLAKYGRLAQIEALNPQLIRNTYLADHRHKKESRLA